MDSHEDVTRVHKCRTCGAEFGTVALRVEHQRNEQHGPRVEVVGKLPDLTRFAENAKRQYADLNTRLIDATGLSHDDDILDHFYDECPEVADLTMSELVRLVEAAPGERRGWDAVRHAVTLTSAAPMLIRSASTPARRVQGAPRRQRARATASHAGRARAPDDDGGREPPPRRLTPLERLGLRLLIDHARRARVADVGRLKPCRGCHRELEPEYFSRGCHRCKSCESDRVRDYQRANRPQQAVAA